MPLWPDLSSPPPRSGLSWPLDVRTRGACLVDVVVLLVWAHTQRLASISTQLSRSILSLQIHIRVFAR
jgi:hypothetical protein